MTDTLTPTEFSDRARMLLRTAAVEVEDIFEGRSCAVQCGPELYKNRAKGLLYIQCPAGMTTVGLRMVSDKRVDIGGLSVFTDALDASSEFRAAMLTAVERAIIEKTNARG